MSMYSMLELVSGRSIAGAPARISVECLWSACESNLMHVQCSAENDTLPARIQTLTTHNWLLRPAPILLFVCLDQVDHVFDVVDNRCVLPDTGHTHTHTNGENESKRNAFSVSTCRETNSHQLVFLKACKSPRNKCHAVDLYGAIRPHRDSRRRVSDVPGSCQDLLASVA